MIKNRLDQPARNKGLLVGWREWANRRRFFGERREREMRGTGLRAVTTDEEIVSACEVSIAFYPSMGGRERSQEGDRRPGGAVKDPVATRDFHVELVAVPTLPKLQSRSVALHHSSPWRGWVKRTSWSIDTPCFDWHFHLQTYAGCFRPLVSSEEHQMALSRGTS